MITPKFTCSQTDESVIVAVYCPSIRASDIAVNVDETLFSLHVNPYFLRLNFTHPLLEDESSSARYDPGSGFITVSLTKETRGQEFKDLDLLAKLLAPRPSKTTPVIEVLDDDLSSSMENFSIDDDISQAVKDDWQLPQEVPGSPSSLKAAAVSHYGFLNRHSGYFEHVSYTENEVNELGSDAENLTPSERRLQRIKHENDKWDEEYYLADFADTEYIDSLIEWESTYHAIQPNFEFSEAEKLTLLNLPRVEFFVSSCDTWQIYLTLCTLLFSFAYDSRTTQHDPTPESAWTISTLTPAFSALDPPPYMNLPRSDSPNNITQGDIVSTLVPSFRRCLAFPLYRSYALAQKCQGDVADILSQGVRMVTRSLLEMKDILDHHEVYYVYSKVWVNDFCIWVQTHATDEMLCKLGECVKAAQVPKDALGWNLVELEKLVDAEEENERSTDSDDESDSDSN